MHLKRNLIGPQGLQHLAHARDVHRGGKSAAAAPPSFQKFDTAPLPRRDVMKSERHRGLLKKTYRCRAATATILKIQSRECPVPQRKTICTIKFV